MIHIICQDFKSTSGNHAGMRHLYQEIAKKKRDVRLRILNINGVGIRYCNRIIAFLCALTLAVRYRKGDKILLTEYLFRGAFQDLIVKVVKLFHSDAIIYAMVHLTSKDLEKMYTQKEMVKLSSEVTCLITLGHSLTLYLKSLGIDNVHTSFHYLDTSFYKVLKKEHHSPLTVIAMGAVARNFKLLAHIVKESPQVNFIICKGRKKIDELFNESSNVTLVGYVEERELRKLMEYADVSLNVMDDTIGSNVVCSSLGMGLAMVCSDVGSIRDYCSEENTVFCKTAEDYILALKELSLNVERISKMQQSSLMSASKFSIDNYVQNVWTLMGEC